LIVAEKPARIQLLGSSLPEIDPGIHVFVARSKTWMAGTSPAAMTTGRSYRVAPE
jgi:hypothetical protein